MRNLLLKPKVLIIIIIILTLIPSCNNEELFIDEAYLIDKQENLEEEDSDNNEDEDEVAAEDAAAAAAAAAAESAKEAKEAAEAAAAEAAEAEKEAAKEAAKAAAAATAKEAAKEAEARAEKAAAEAEKAAAAAAEAAEEAAKEAAAAAAAAAAKEAAEAAKEEAKEAAAAAAKEAAKEAAEAAAAAAKAAAEENNEDIDETLLIVLNDYSASTTENIAVDLKVYMNDSNLPAEIVFSNTDPINGVLTLNDNNTPYNLADDTVVYTPKPAFSGMDSFEYTICDANNIDNCDTATVSITVEPRENDFASILKAFPGAYGAGALTATGGRGGSVYHVTNLNNSGPGSFRDAVSSSNRIIVFDVSGTINLTSSLNINADNLTIAGQTAPIGGIAITGQSIYFSGANNIITRYIRFRPVFRVGGSAATVGDALNVNNCSNSIMDHCSISWGGDEAYSLTASSGNSDNWTISNNIFAESKTGTLIGNTNGNLPNNISLHGNLWYNISHRHPNMGAPRIDLINNMVHNWYTRLSVMGHFLEDMKVNQINNYYQRGAVSKDVLDSPYVNWVDVRIGTPDDFVSIYTSGNVIDGVMSANDDSWEKGFYKYRFDISSGTYAGSKQWDNASTNFQANTPFPYLGAALTTMTAEQVRTSVPDNAGACKTLDGSGNVIVNRDAVDEHYLGYVKTNTYQSYAYKADMESGGIRNRSHYIAYQNAVSSTPINARDENYDTDKDGMPDVWEKSTFGDLTKTAMGDNDGDGYTNLEEFLNQVDK
jgi:hypothetical protein